jgi:hypothetical protein
MFSKNSSSETLNSQEKKNGTISKCLTKRKKSANSYESPVNISPEISRKAEISLSLINNEFNEEQDDSEEMCVNFLTPTVNSNNKDEVCYKNILNFQNELHPAPNIEKKEPVGDKLGPTRREHDKKKIIFEKKQYKNENERRKYSIDSLHKKIKRLFFDFLENKIKTLLDVSNPPKIPHNIISNVTIKSNKKILSYTISEFYLHICNYNFTQKSKENASKISSELYKLLNIKIKDYFILYFKEQFEKDLSLLAQKESVYYCNKLKQRAFIFVEYYTKLKPYQKKLKTV